MSTAEKARNKNPPTSSNRTTDLTQWIAFSRKLVYIVRDHINPFGIYPKSKNREVWDAWEAIRFNQILVWTTIEGNTLLGSQD